MKGPNRRACGPTQAFPDLDASVVYQDGYPLLVASEESLEKVGEEVNRWANGEVDGENIGTIDDLWKTSRVPIERCVCVITRTLCTGDKGKSLTVTRNLDSDRTSCSVVLVSHLWKM